MEELFNLTKKVERYKDVLSNTRQYRQVWQNELCAFIQNKLTEIVAESGIPGEVTCKKSLENLEAVQLTLGESKSGIYENINDDVKRHLIKHHGSLIYQQLFNGKVIVLINYPFIENYGQPRPPKTVAIYRPEEVKFPYLVRHVEQFITDITAWEDFDDDEPNQKIGFQLNFPTEEQLENSND